MGLVTVWWLRGPSFQMRFMVLVTHVPVQMEGDPFAHAHATYLITSCIKETLGAFF